MLSSSRQKTTKRHINFFHVFWYICRRDGWAKISKSGIIADLLNFLVCVGTFILYYYSKMVLLVTVYIECRWRGDRLGFSASRFKNCCVKFSFQSSIRIPVRGSTSRTLFGLSLRTFSSLMKPKSPKIGKKAPDEGSKMLIHAFHASR